MTWSTIWTLLPNGYDGPGRLALSLVAAPRVEGSAATLAGSPLVDWPDFVAGLAPLRIVSDDGAVDEVATIESPAPDPVVWAALFPPSTPVASPGPPAAALPAVLAGPSITDASREIDRLTAAFVRASPDRWPTAGDDVVAPLRALARPDRPAFGSRGERRAAHARLARSGDPDLSAAAATLAVASIADHLRQRSDRPATRLGRRIDHIGDPDPVAAIGRIDEVDFHQVVGLVLAHPLLAVRLGLRLDVTIPAFTGPRTLRAVRLDGSPLDGEVPRRQPWSRVVADPSTRRFVMVPQPGAPTEVVDGMLDLGGGSDDGNVVVTTTDVIGVALQLDALARNRLTPDRLRPGDVVPLPPQRDVGFTIAKAERGIDVAAHALARAVALDPTAPGSDTVLFADDVTTGYRLDVAVDGGPFHSLMRRRSTYTVGATTFSGDDEGRVEALPVLAEAAPSASGGSMALLAGEDVVGWDGWLLGVPRPGRAVLGDGAGAPPTVEVDPEPAPGFDLRHQVAVIRGTAVPLRFGRDYEFRARAVDLAGNAVAPGDGDRSHTIAGGRYLRRGILPSPELVPRRRFTPGESHTHLVVRTDGNGDPGRPCERHVVLPKASQHLAETHGRFDAAFGPGVAPAVRDRILQLASRESGTFLDPTVPGPDGQPTPTPGLAIVSNDPSRPPRVRLPLPPGVPLPNGAYAIHDTDRMVTPYLPDPMAGGISVLGLPGADGPVVVPATGRGWPDLVPTRLVVRPGAPGTEVAATTSAGGQVLELTVPPAARFTVELASTVDPDVLDQIDPGGHTTKELVIGTAITRCARQTVTIVHAVERPLSDPTLPSPPQLGALQRDGNSVEVSATIGYHPPSTGEVHLLATWADEVDPGSGALESQRRLATLAPTRVGGGDGTAPVTATLALGDTRRHDVTYRAVATSPFREHFEPGTPATRQGQAATIVVKNRSRPPAPVVHSVVPLFRTSRSSGGGVYEATRVTDGVRVLLERPWNVTGRDERLGVVVYRASADATTNGGKLLRELVTRWGTDPLQEQQPQATEHLLANRFGGQSDLVGAATLPEGPPSTPPVPVPKVDVVAYPVTFDAERGRWFADVLFSGLGLPESAWPFLRLAVVRNQPQSLSGCHLSPVTVAPFVQVPPPRTVKAVRSGDVGVRVTVTGTPVAHSTFTLRQERRIPEPSVRTLDLAVDATNGWRVRSQPPTGGALADLILEPVGATPPAPALQDLINGRVVVEEIQQGLALRRNATIQRVVFTETFDRATVGMQGAPDATPRP